MPLLPLEDEHPGAAASIREGLEETLTLQALGLDPQSALYRTLRSTNPIENLNGSVARYSRNVKRWRGGSMILRWVCAAVENASHRFRAVRGCRELAALIKVLALRDSQQNSTAEQVAWYTHATGAAALEVQQRSGQRREALRRTKAPKTARAEVDPGFRTRA